MWVWGLGLSRVACSYQTFLAICSPLIYNNLSTLFTFKVSLFPTKKKKRKKSDSYENDECLILYIPAIMKD